MGNTNSSQNSEIIAVALGTRNSSPYGFREDDKNQVGRIWKEPVTDLIPYNYQRKEMPIDKEGYIESFTSNQTEEIKNFFDEYGVVVIRDLLDQEEIERTKDEVWARVRHECPWVDRYFPLLKNFQVIVFD